MLTGIHFLLTYACTYECDHCFVFSSPNAEGTFTAAQVTAVLDEAVKLGTVRDIYFEGGEPFLFYQLLVEGIRLAHDRGFKVGAVTNAYWAVSEEDAILCLKPLIEAGLSRLSVSDDQFHGDEEADRPPLRAVAAARKLGLNVDSICIEQPVVYEEKNGEETKGAKVVGGGALLKGRAAEKLAADLPKRPWKLFDSCPYEDFAEPGRVHVDAYGHVHICQGVSIGNLWQAPLSKLIRDYSPSRHPIGGPLHEGGPVALALKYNLNHDDTYVDACHFCYTLRRSLIDAYPEYLAPRQVYGEDK